MKYHLTRILVLLNFCSAVPYAQAGWFGQNDEHKERLIRVEQELAVERSANDTWVRIAGALAVGAVLLLIIGTALGATVKRHAPKS